MAKQAAQYTLGGNFGNRVVDFFFNVVVSGLSKVIAYLSEGIVGERSRNDATHVAAATVARADAIISWNFRHIVRLDRIRAYNQVNLLNGHGILTILTPREVCEVRDARNR